MKTLLISTLLSAVLVCCFFSFHDISYIGGGPIVCFFVGWALVLCFPVAFVLWLIRKGL